MSETPRTDFVENGPTSRRAMPYLARDLERELARLKAGIKVVLTQNAHLSDGETCTLAVLKKLVPEWESEFLPNAGGMARELAAQDSESPTRDNG